MSDPTPITIQKKKFSEFDYLTNLSTGVESTYMVGYKVLDQASSVNNNIRLNLASLINTVAEIVEGGGGGDISIQVPVIQGDDYDPASYATGQRGFWVYNRDGHKIIVIDMSQFGTYIQFNDIPDELLNHDQTVNFNGETVTVSTFDICFAHTILGESERVYLPNFGPEGEYTPDKKYALRLWREDPYNNVDGHLHFEKIQNSSIVFVSDPAQQPTVPSTQTKCYDWFAKFLMLSVVKDGLINIYARTQEVFNIFDEDEVQGE